LLTGPVFGVNTNLTTYALFIGNNEPYVYSNISMSLRMPLGFIVMPQAQYGYTQNQLISAKVGVEKHLFVHGFMNLSLERNFRSNLSMGEVGFRYDFSFAQTGFSARQTNDRTTLVQYARGSLINDSRTKYLRADNRNNVGKGGITIVPYIDINANGKRDNGEQKLSGLNLHTSMGRVEISESDTTIRILGLEPYTKCFIELNEGSFDNIAWRLKTRTYSVAVDPNQLKLLEVPVMVQGEASGTVRLEKDGETRGQERIIVRFFTSNFRPVSRTLTEEDGYFSYLGLTPGSYIARIDTAQLRKLQMTSRPDSLTFTIRTDIDGDIVDGLDFTLRKIVSIDTTKLIAPPEKIVKGDTSYIIIHEEVRELVTITEDYWAMQLGAFKNKAYAEAWMKRISAVVDKDVELIYEDGFYKVRVTGFKDRDELDSYIPALQNAGFTEIWIIHNKAKIVERITTRQDSIARITETVIEKQTPVVVSGTILQVGMFLNKEDAAAILDRLLAAVENLITVRNEGGLYRIQISDVKDSTEIQDLIPILEKNGFRNIVLINPQEISHIPITGARIDSLIVEEVKTNAEKQPIPVIATPAPAVPGIALHAGHYYKRAAAERVKARIIRKLGIPAEVIQEWDSYHVVVTGFFTREETFRYYPELAGLGFTEVYVMELPPQKKP
ncbi:MAG TPA: SPOR domain-containing protein, partial [Bacteroidales bacterium]|nr:SPOR domain-containing protein [Bacteroidales bacterium]